MKATPKDCQYFFDVRNEETARLQFTNPEKILWKDHVVWYGKSIRSKKRKFFTIRFDRRRIGYIRFQQAETGSGSYVSVCLEPPCRGLGLGTKSIQLACGKMKRPVYAEIKAENLGSIKAFEKAGFKREKESCRLIRYVLS